MRKGKLIISFVILILVFSIMFVSAFSFVDFWEKITGKATSCMGTNGTDPYDDCGRCKLCNGEGSCINIAAGFHDVDNVYNYGANTTNFCEGNVSVGNGTIGNGIIANISNDNDNDGVLNDFDCNDNNLSISLCSGCQVCSENFKLLNNTGKCIINNQSGYNSDGCPYPKYSSFSPTLTTNFTKTGLTNVNEVKLGVPGKAIIEFNQPVNLVRYNNSTNIFEPLDLDSNIIMQDKKIIFNSDNLPELNVASWITFFNVSFKYPRILKDNVEYKDYLDLILPTEQNNYTLKVLVPHYTTYEIVEGTAPVVTTPPSGGGSSGGGGGGGSSSTTIIPPKKFEFELDKEQINTKIKKGDTQTLEFVITNNENSQMQISLSSDSDRIDLLNNLLTLNPKESKTVQFNVFSEEDEAANLYLEKIFIKSKNLKREILVAVEIISVDSLFDVKIEILNQSVIVKPGGGGVLGQIFLSNLMSKPMTEDVVINYIIKDKNGKVIVSEKETESVGVNTNYLKEIYLSKNLKDGKYVYYVQVNYQGKTASASAWFNVGKESGPTEYSSLLVSIIVVIFIISIILAFLIYKYMYRYKQEKILVE